MIFEEHVLPIIRGLVAEDGITLARLHGSAFFINSRGFMLTAKHVLNELDAEIGKDGGHAFVLLADPSNPAQPVPLSIQQSEAAPEPYDVRIVRVAPWNGRVGLKMKACFGLVTDESKIGVWTDLLTIGYPISASGKAGSRDFITSRSYRGHIVRKIPAGDKLLHPHPAIFELNFPIPRGVSGAPLLVGRANHDLFGLLGVCVGNQASEIAEFEFTTVDESGAKYVERKVRVEEYGLVHDIRPLKDWRRRYLPVQRWTRRSSCRLQPKRRS
jgi:hypothetical protein